MAKEWCYIYVSKNRFLLESTQHLLKGGVWMWVKSCRKVDMEALEDFLISRVGWVACPLYQNQHKSLQIDFKVKDLWE